eukprot:jgi/Tetstr1/429541/TSEL_019446.t1
MLRVGRLRAVAGVGGARAGLSAGRLDSLARSPLCCRGTGLLAWDGRDGAARQRAQQRGVSANAGTTAGGGQGAAVGEDSASSLLCRAACAKLLKTDPLPAGLYLVGTPIGNLEDITLRALRVLQSATAVLAEDTRQTRKLLDHFGISTHLVSYHAHNERSREEEVLKRLLRGELLALVSDAGMPGISDPGSALVAAAAGAGLPVVPVPGPCAVVAGLVGSGLPTEEFTFAGFLPAKPLARRQRLLELSGNAATVVLYVPPHSLAATLRDAAEVMGSDRRCCVARELTKVYEEFWRSSLSDAAHEFTERAPKGEVTLVIEGGATDAQAVAAASIDIEAEVTQLLAGGCSVSEVSKTLSRRYPSVGRKKIYAMATAAHKAQAEG